MMRGSSGHNFFEHTSSTGDWPAVSWPGQRFGQACRWRAFRDALLGRFFYFLYAAVRKAEAELGGMSSSPRSDSSLLLSFRRTKMNAWKASRCIRWAIAHSGSLAGFNQSLVLIPRVMRALRRALERPGFPLSHEAAHQWRRAAWEALSFIEPFEERGWTPKGWAAQIRRAMEALSARY